MRVTPVLLSLLALSGAFSLAACSGADLPRVTTGLNCAPPGQQSVSCTLPLTSPAGFKITMVSTSCNAVNDEIDLTLPITAVLTTDACSATVPKVWDYSTPINPAGTQINLEFHSDQVVNTPGTHVTGAYPSWTISFEDGGDTDFNDVVLTVDAIPAS